jgi:hypothetical protein
LNKHTARHFREVNKNTDNEEVISFDETTFTFHPVLLVLAFGVWVDVGVSELCRWCCWCWFRCVHCVIHKVCSVACSAVCSTVYSMCSVVQCSAVQCYAVQCNAVQCNAVKYSAVQCSAVQETTEYEFMADVDGQKIGILLTEVEVWPVQCSAV